MTSMIEQRPLPSVRQLLQATATAMLVASILLGTVVLPAEYGVDPTGVGAKLGLTKLGAEHATVPPPSPALPPSATGPVWTRPASFRNDDLSVVLNPEEGCEIKATMQQSERFLFSWTATGGKVECDMHGEEKGAPQDQFTSYWKEDAMTSGHGGFVAPFTGIHGWYWHNSGKQPVTVRVRTSGFYEKIAEM